MPAEIYYWEALIIDPEVAERYANVITQLQNRELKSAGFDLKKMRHHRIFSVSTSYSGRLLFTIQELNKKNYLIFLEELPNHEYPKSKFLNSPSTLKHFLEKNHKGLEQIVTNFDDEFIDIDELPFSMDEEDEQQRVFTPVEYYDQAFIALNSSQKEAKYAKGPADIEGPPGSGKSCAAQSLIANAPAELTKIIYLTSSAALVEHMEQVYRSLPVALENPPGRVSFKSYLQLVHETDPTAMTKKTVGQEQFLAWYSDYCDRKEQQLRTAQTGQGRGRGKGKRVQQKVHLLPEEILDAETVYQEFRTIAAYSDYEDKRFGTSKEYTRARYEQLGEKHQSLFKKEHRSWLYQAFVDYKTYLEHSQSLDLSFYRLRSSEEYDMVVVDEAQDFSKSQIQDITALTSPALQIYFCRDSHQGLSDSQSSGPFIHEHVYRLSHKTGIKLQHINLPCSYRVFPNAQPLVDKILDLRLKLIGGRADNLEYVRLPLTVEQNSTLGSVYWFDKVPETTQQILQNAIKSSDLIVITLPDFKKEAKAFFNTDLVYTVDQVKGLQFPVVVLYRMVEDEALLEANKVLAKPEHSYVASSSTAHRPAAGVGNPKFGPPLNRLFTAVTRAQQQIIIIQPPKHQFSHLITACKSVELSTDEFKLELDKQSYSEEKWLELAKKLISKNELELARTIYVNHLQKPADEFEAYIRATKTPPTLSVLESSVASTSSPMASQPTAASSSSSVDAERSTSVHTLGLFAHQKTTQSSAHSQRRRKGRGQQENITLPPKTDHAPAGAASVIPSELRKKSTAETSLDSKPSTDNTSTKRTKRGIKKLKQAPKVFDQPKHTPTKYSSRSPASRTKVMSSNTEDEFFKGMKFLNAPPMEELFEKLKQSTSPGLDLSLLLSCGALDIKKLRELFFYHPESKALITVAQLCSVGEQPHLSLLSQLCSPYSESNHVALFYLFDQEIDTFKTFAAGVKYFLLSFEQSFAEESQEINQTYMAFFQKKSAELRELYFLHTTETGQIILAKLAKEIEWDLELFNAKLAHVFRMNLEPNFPVPLQSMKDTSKLPDHELLAMELNQTDEESWKIIVSRHPGDDISRAIVRLIAQANFIGEDLWRNAVFQNVPQFFVNMSVSPNIKSILTEQEQKIAEEISSVLNSSPYLTLIEHKKYLEAVLNDSTIDRTSILTGIIRVIRKHLIREHNLVNELYTKNMRFWRQVTDKYSDLFPNSGRVLAILDQLSVQDALAMNAWESLINSKVIDQNDVWFLLWNFFGSCKSQQNPLEAAHSTLINNIFTWLVNNKGKSLKTYFDYITQCLQSTNLHQFSSLAGYLRLAQDFLAKELLQQRLKSRMPDTPPVALPSTSTCSPDRLPSSTGQENSNAEKESEDEQQLSDCLIKR